MRLQQLFEALAAELPALIPSADAAVVVAYLDAGTTVKAILNLAPMPAVTWRWPSIAFRISCRADTGSGERHIANLLIANFSYCGDADRDQADFERLDASAGFGLRRHGTRAFVS